MSYEYDTRHKDRTHNSLCQICSFEHFDDINLKRQVLDGITAYG